MDIFSSLLQADKNLFKLINSDLSVPWLDGFMLLMRNSITWIPLYAFLLFWFYKKGKPFFFMVVFMSLLCVGLTDFISSGILKPLIGRLRPCYEPGLDVRLLLGCGGRYSMPSSHSTNHFGQAMFWFSVVSYKFNKKWYWVWPWAIIICYAQVYVGKHYPGDILLGMILGITIGFISSRLFRRLELYVENRKKRLSSQPEKSPERS
jgi:undecaprenyl-diphosphatase